MFPVSGGLHGGCWSPLWSVLSLPADHCRPALSRPAVRCGLLAPLLTAAPRPASLSQPFPGFPDIWQPGSHCRPGPRAPAAPHRFCKADRGEICVVAARPAHRQRRLAGSAGRPAGPVPALMLECENGLCAVPSEAMYRLVSGQTTAGYTEHCSSATMERT